MTTKTALLATLALAVLACEKPADGTNPPTTGGEVTDTPTDSGGDTAGSGDGGGEAKSEPGAPDKKWADKDGQPVICASTAGPFRARESISRRARTSPVRGSP